MRKKQRKRIAQPGLQINWQDEHTAHFVIETKQGPVHFGIRMSKSPSRNLRLLDPLKRVRLVPTENP